MATKEEMELDKDIRSAMRDAPATNPSAGGIGSYNQFSADPGTAQPRDLPPPNYAGRNADNIEPSVDGMNKATMFQSVADVTGNQTPAQAQGLQEQGPAWSSMQGIGGEQIYKNTNVDPKKYGQAIYSDSAMGATPQGFDQDIQNNGQGVTDTETGMGYTPVSQTDISGLQSPELQQKPGGIEMAGINPTGTNSPYGQNQYGPAGQGTNGITVIGQDGNWWDQGRYKQTAQQEAQDIMSRMPYGSAGDRAKRRSMLEQARILMLGGADQNRMDTANKRLDYDYSSLNDKAYQGQQQRGIDAMNANTNYLNATRPSDPVKMFEQVDPVMSKDIYGNETMVAPGGTFSPYSGEYKRNAPAQGGQQQIPEGVDPVAFQKEAMEAKTDPIKYAEFVEKYSQ